MDCPACGAPNEDDALFCGSCGTTLNTASTPTAGDEAVQDLVADVGARIEVGRENLPGVAAPIEATSSPAPRRAPVDAVAKFLPTSGTAISALIFGIGGLTFLPFLGSIVAVILGPMARSDIRRRPDEVTGDGIALVGLVLGWIGIGLTVLGLLFFGAIALCALVGAFGATFPTN